MRGLLGLLVCWAAGNLVAGDSVDIKTNYYRVFGDTVPALRQSISANRPWKGRRQMDARTTWELNWKFRTSGGPSPTLLSFETKTSVEVTLPLWSPTTNAPSSVRQQWQRYMKALIEHEEGHKRIARQAAQATRRKVEGLPPASSSEELRTSIQKAVDAVMSEYRKKDAGYDRATRHGLTQGAHFP